MVDSLVIGNGEVGQALYKILNERIGNKTCWATDIKDSDFKEVLLAGCDTLHVCFPYAESFESDVIQYVRDSNAKLIIIHSTVQIGTTDNIDDVLLPCYVVHSPIQGQHTDLVNQILYFDKFIGTRDYHAYQAAKAELSNLNCVHVTESKATELGKLLSTSYYGLCIAWHREMKEMCDKTGVSFEDAVTNFNIAYNEGYSEFKPNVVRPVLTPPSGSIEGHCVVQNARLLSEKLQSTFLSLIW